jgi:hypothetical protein
MAIQKSDVKRPADGSFCFCFYGLQQSEWRSEKGFGIAQVGNIRVGVHCGPLAGIMLTYADVCWRMLTYADVCW